MQGTRRRRRGLTSPSQPCWRWRSLIGPWTPAAFHGLTFTPQTFPPTFLDSRYSPYGGPRQLAFCSCQGATHLIGLALQSCSLSCMSTRLAPTSSGRQPLAAYPLPHCTARLCSTRISAACLAWSPSRLHRFGSRPRGKNRSNIPSNRQSAAWALSPNADLFGSEDLARPPLLTGPMYSVLLN